MGNLGSALLRPLKNFNIEARAHRELDKQKLKSVLAPRYKQPAVTQGQEEREPGPVIYSKDELLHERLKVVRVESIGPANKPFKNPKLPDRSTTLPEPKYGVVEPAHVPPGRVTISQALNLISQHQTNPKLYSTSHIASEYKLELHNAQQILKYFQVFHMHIPKKMEEKFPHLLTVLKSQMSQMESERQRKLLDFAKEAKKPSKKEIREKNIEKS
ncbi:NADH dehydrogenase [ubiquinone] 1 alpha subcomplex assembly factor 4 isoform X2 [Octopus bimaculoides]|uniref:NADH dehydrogenase [ubiquinone] 1 alpha subcomplex assembly factor 4 n=1 Tax=Octopus bimaculoides TaxID=37653 RepID=A0A0L8FKW2_OCTBM|nr:NADH dehydrogenase [ubiquinone] 1 alpha subcomplex assembly factor 4 isoform X2 [Octopus bimaculoides]|eukprot:XP_014788969.1 PREDICTED: NADH dehydrogenase [ubiquinone] 1 alpha subcomplex assembly factor 4-like isoform X2 [Octopus bimaculoides]